MCQIWWESVKICSHFCANRHISFIRGTALRCFHETFSNNNGNSLKDKKCYRPTVDFPRVLIERRSMKNNLKDYTIQFCYGWALKHAMTMTYYNFSTYYKTRTIILGMKNGIGGGKGVWGSGSRLSPSSDGEAGSETVGSRVKCRRVP